MRPALVRRQATPCRRGAHPDGHSGRVGSRSKRGIKVAGVLYSLLETAKLSGVDPAAYLAAATTAALEDKDATLLPHDFSS